MDPFSALVGVVWMAGGAFFIWAPKSRWYRHRLEMIFGEKTDAIAEERTRWYRMIGYGIGLIGLVRLVTS